MKKTNLKNVNVKMMVVDGILKDVAEMNRETEDQVFEKIVVNTFLTDNEQIQQWLKQLYVQDGEDDADRLARVMNSVFSFLAAGNDGKPSYNGGDAFVKFAYDNLLREKHYQSQRKYDEAILSYFCDQIDCVVEVLKNSEKRIDNIKKRTAINNDAEELERMKKRVLNVDQGMLLYIYVVLREHWDVLEQSTYTYRLLAAISWLQTWDDNAEERVKLVKKLKEFSKNIKC